jgi:hypothetical protein
LFVGSPAASTRLKMGVLAPIPRAKGGQGFPLIHRAEHADYWIVTGL